MNEPRLDAEIERAVREMLDVSPAPDFRGRVLAQIEERPPRTTWPRAAWGAAAAALVLGAMLLRDAPRELPASAPELTSSRQQNEQIATVTAAHPAAPVRAPREQPQATRRSTGPARHTLSPVIPAADDLPPIDVRELVVAPPATPTEIEPDAIVIVPLPEPADVVVEPLSFPPGARE